VVVYEDFLCPFCRQLETSTRDFLHQDAAKGSVQVEYRPFQLLPDDYSRRALDAWATVLQKGTPAQALRFHDLLYDEQPYEQAAHKPGVAALRALARKAGVTDPKVLDASGRRTRRSSPRSRGPPSRPGCAARRRCSSTASRSGGARSRTWPTGSSKLAAG
jgi:hypothetical protein